jgi:pimeloyl-ACP methyl ester carboxylesterase
MNIYFISGLGADHRAFDKLDLPAYCSKHYIQWLLPNNKETLQLYVKRLLSQIDLTKPFSLIGLSFGGMVAVELGKITNPEKIILISSVANRSQLPWHYKALGHIKFYSYLPLRLMKQKNKITYWFFGTKDKDEQKILGEIITETDSTYLKWALKMISTWKNKVSLPNLIHIHGDADRLFPIQFVKPHITVRKGSHLMVREQADEISKYLKEIF